MTTIAIVEDNRQDIEVYRQILDQYTNEYKQEFIVFEFTDPLEFIDTYTAKYDIILMDIELPYITGMDAAERIRKSDQTVVIVFITNMPQYAIRGYSVQALDYVLKPVNYYSLSSVIKKAVKHINREDIIVTVKNGDGLHRVHVSELKYVEVIGHKSIYHTTSKDIEVYTTIKKIEEKLPDDVFIRCSNAYLVNLKFVDSVDKDGIHVGDATITLSRKKKKEFMDRLNEFCGEM